MGNGVSVVCDRGMMWDHWETPDTGDDPSGSLASSHLGQGVGLSLPLAVVDTVVEGGDSGGVAEHGGGGVADGSSGDNGSVSSAVTSVQEGQSTSVSLASGHLAKGIGLGVPLAVVDIVVESGDRGVGGGDSGVCGDRGMMGDHWETPDTSDDPSGSLASSHLGQGVGLSLPLAVVDAVVESGDGGVGGGDSGVVEGDPAHLGHSGLSGVGDDADVVKTTLDQGVLSGLTSSDLGDCPGLGVSGDSRNGQAKLKIMLSKYHCIVLLNLTYDERFHG